MLNQPDVQQQLTIDDIGVNNGSLSVSATTSPRHLDPLAHLIAGQIEAAVRPEGKATRPPGGLVVPRCQTRAPPRRRAPPHLHNRLQAASVDVRASKNTAIAALVTELPGPVVADALNLHPSTIDRWARSLAAPWQTYSSRPAR